MTSKWAVLGYIVSGLALPQAVTALTIKPIYDGSVTSLANASAVENAFNAVAADYSSQFSSPITINVAVSWGSVAGQALPSNAVGASSDSLYGYFSYGQVKNWLTASARSNPSDTALVTALSSLPATAPAGQSQYAIASSEMKALGLISGSGTGTDGSIGFAGSTSGYSFNNSGTIAAGTYDFAAVAAHELDEVLGRISGVDSGGFRTVLDLFRYSAPGTLSYSSTSAAYFSIDGGRTDLNNFNSSINGGDRGDWATSGSTSDIQDAFIGTGQRKNLSVVDLTALDVLGYGGRNAGDTAAGNPSGVVFGLVTPDAVPEPAVWTMLLTGFGLIGAARRRRQADRVQTI